jgi:hypothetical protein
MMTPLGVTVSSANAKAAGIAYMAQMGHFHPNTFWSS